MNTTSIFSTIMENMGQNTILFTTPGAALGLGAAAFLSHKLLLKSENPSAVTHVKYAGMGIGIVLGGIFTGAAAGYTIDQITGNSFKKQRARTAEACKGISASGDILRMEKDRDGNITCLIRASATPNIRMP